MLLNFQISGPNLVEPNAFGPVLVCAPGFPMNGQTRVCFEPKPEAEKRKTNLFLAQSENEEDEHVSVREEMRVIQWGIEEEKLRVRKSKQESRNEAGKLELGKLIF